MSLVVNTPAADLHLLTDEQLRVAYGLASDDDSMDDELQAIGLRVAAEIADYCGVRAGSGGVPTLRQERVTETLRRVTWSESLVLSRRHEVSVVSVSVGGSGWNASAYDVDAEAGILYRTAIASPLTCATVVVVYDAGFDEVPAELAGAAMDLMRVRVAEADADPRVKSESTEVPDVLTERVDYWVGALPGSTAAGGLPADIAARLARFRNVSVA